MGFEFLELYHILFLVLGVIVGIIIGALPGLTPTMGVALFIPFTFTLPAVDGLILLGGIYCGSVYGGSIPSILFNVPGAPASVATTFDGYPMAQQGQARKALELSTIASAFGGIVGMLLLLFFAPILVVFSLKFGPSHSFWIAMFGITVIAAISEGPITKNLLGGFLGILLSFIGISTFTGMSRFTFGTDALVGGLHVVAVLIGLFAFPQALRLIEEFISKKKQESAISTLSKSSVRSSFSDVLKKPKAATIGSSIGALIGMIPGAGGNVASILAYNEVKRFSKNKKQFGKGSKDGIIAAESANNAMVGGSLIPLLTLGIPGSPTAAIFLGGLLIHGIWPGRNLFIENASIAYTFLYSMLLAQIVLLVVGLISIKYISRLTTIPNYFMAPMILSFCIIGAYATQNSVFDIYTMVIIGVVMFLLQKYQFSPAPIALGFILGVIAEQGLLQGMYIGASNGSALAYFFSGYGNIILVSLVVITIGISFFQQASTFRKLPSLEKFSVKNLLVPNTLVLLGLLGAIVYGYFHIASQALEQRLAPQITFAVLFVLIGYRLMKALFSEKTKTPFVRMDIPLACFIIFVIIVSLMTNILGFYIQVILLMISCPLFAYWYKSKRTSIVKITFISFAFTFALYFIFTGLVKVPLPDGLLSFIP